tara:strand:- start:1663 stop:1803 length:141 start_codon:yes stop_codon:yes gene_type:complete
LIKKYKSKIELKVFENNGHWMMEENNWKKNRYFDDPTMFIAFYSDY